MAQEAAPPPASAEERIKRELHPLDSFSRLLDCAVENRPPGCDDRFRFRWFGLFYQAPRQDAFLLRLRLPGGRLEDFQLAGLARITQECGSGCVVLNGQGGLDVPGVPVRAAVEILRRIEGIGLSALRTGGDCVQSVRGGEHEGWAGGDGQGSVYRLVCQLEQALAHDRALSDLPRPCEIVFRTLQAAPDARGDAVVFQAVPDERPSPGENAESGRLPAFFWAFPGEEKGGFLLPSAGIVPACLRLLGGWAGEADRTDREKAGFAEYCAGLGREKMEALLGAGKWQDSPPDAGRRTTSDADRSPAGIDLPDGRLLSSQLAALARIVRETNLPGVRFAYGKLYVVPGAGEAGTAALLGAALAG